MAKAWFSAVKAVTDARIRQASICNKEPTNKLNVREEPEIKPMKFVLEHQQPVENQLFSTTQILNMIEQSVDDYCTQPSHTSNNIIRLHKAEPDFAVPKDTTIGAPTCVVQPLGILEAGVPTGKSFQPRNGTETDTPESLNWSKSREVSGGKFAAWKAQKLEAAELVGTGSRSSENEGFQYGSGPDSAKPESANWFKSHEASGKLAAWKAQKDEAEAISAARMQQEQDEMTTPLASAVGHGVTKRKLEFEEEELDDSPASNWKRNCLDREQIDATPISKDCDNDNESDAADSECNSEAELGTPEWMDSGDEEDRGVRSDAEVGAGSDQDTNSDQQVPSIPKTPGAKVEAEANEEDSDQDAKKKKYQCKYCDETFERKKKFKKHMRRKHDSRKDQESSLPETKSSKKEESRRSGYVKKSIPCNCCSKRFLKESALIEHLNRKKGIRFACETCESSYSTKDSLQRHQRDSCPNKKRPYLCKICKLPFASSGDYADHKKKEHGSHREDNSFKCNSCEKVFQGWNSLVYHTRTHTNEPFACPQCDESFSRDWDYRKHRKSAHGKEGGYKCDKCESHFGRRRDLASHLKRSHGDSETRDGRD